TAAWWPPRPGRTARPASAARWKRAAAWPAARLLRRGAPRGARCRMRAAPAQLILPRMRLLLLLLAAASWEKVGDEAGVAVYRREVPGSKFLAVKGTGIVDAPARTVALVLLDDDRAPEWVDSLAEARVVRVVSAAEYIEYNRAAMPLIV